MIFLHHLWLIPLLPALGAAFELLFGRNVGKRTVSVVSVGLPGAAFVWALGCFVELLAQPGHTFTQILYTWLPAGAFHLSNGGISQFVIKAGFLLDPLSAVMVLIVTGVGFLIHVYSIGYMGPEGGYYRFFGYMNLFLFSMLLLVLADNYLLMFAGWEGVGLCSYFLIGFYFERRSAADAGKKAFIVNRIGDAGFLLGVMLITITFGTLNFQQVTAAARSGHFAAGNGVITAICLLLFMGATGKSAQIPLYVWLPGAMEGPTPVSALIHAATMVTAGVYMVARSSALYLLSPAALGVVAAIGAATAIWAASMGLVQNDIKRVLAYSTISQLGYMFLACGVGAFRAGIFHLMTHAFFKALLFLGAGSVIHALGGEQDIRKMGGLWRKLPITFATFLAATLAICGIPGFSGFFSKDEIIWDSISSPYGHIFLWVVGWVTAGLTAFYMFRLLIMTFFGKSRLSAEAEPHVHESPWTMLGVLMALGALSVVGGYVNWPLKLLNQFLAPVFENPAAVETQKYGQGLELGLMMATILIVLVGAGAAYWMYIRRRELPGRLALAAGPAYEILLNKYYVDELYDAVAVNRVKDLGNLLAAFDQVVVDAGVNGVGWTTRLTAELSRWYDKWVVDGLVNAGAFSVKLLSYPVRVIQTGRVQNYAWLITLGAVMFMAYYVLHFK
jgi:NADH-quinone oxidoreductase subunit L